MPFGCLIHVKALSFIAFSFSTCINVHNNDNKNVFQHINFLCIALSSLVTIINNFVLKKIACIYSEESDEMVHESSFWKNIDAKLL